MVTLKLAVAGLLSLPCLAVAIVVAPVLAVLSLPPLLLLVYRTTATNDTESASTGDNVVPDQVIIAGGSSGIGLAIAKECITRQQQQQQQGRSGGVKKITLLARNQSKLEAAQAELQALVSQQQQQSQKETTGATSSNMSKKDMIVIPEIHIVSVSVSDFAALDQAAKELQIPSTDRVVLWNCAGMAYPAEFQKVPLAKFEQQIHTNQLGSMYLTKAFLPHLRQGVIVMTSSAAGQLGVYGYTAYAPTKYAIRGFCETLHAELVRTHPQLSLQLAFPVDTDTPGYQQELETTPEITKLLSDSAGLASAESTAKAMVNAAFCKHPKFQVYFTFEGWMLSNATAGMGPVTDVWDAIAQVTLSGIFRLIGLFYLNDWWHIIRTHPPTTTTTTTATTIGKELKTSNALKKED